MRSLQLFEVTPYDPLSLLFSWLSALKACSPSPVSFTGWRCVLARQRRVGGAFSQAAWSRGGMWTARTQHLCDVVQRFSMGTTPFPGRGPGWQGILKVMQVHLLCSSSGATIANGHKLGSLKQRRCMCPQTCRAEAADGGVSMVEPFRVRLVAFSPGAVLAVPCL